MKCCIRSVTNAMTPLRMQGILAIYSVIALGIAYVAQYGFGFLPCDICSIERGIYFAVAITGILGLRSFFLSHELGLFIQLFILSIGLALTFYHVGVEQHWWEGPASCSGIIGNGTLESFREQLMKTPHPRCDQVTWSFLRISATSWSLMLIGALAFLTTLALYNPEIYSKYQTRKEGEEKKEG